MLKIPKSTEKVYPETKTYMCIKKKKQKKKTYVHSSVVTIIENLSFLFKDFLEKRKITNPNFENKFYFTKPFFFYIIKKKIPFSVHLKIVYLEKFRWVGLFFFLLIY